jgi:hypothetical protein
MAFISALAAVGTGLSAMITSGAIGAGLSAGAAGTLGTLGSGAIIGGGLGAGMSALTGGDPGEGALMGGITGGIAGGLGGLAGSPITSAAESVIPNATGQALTGAPATIGANTTFLSSPVSTAIQQSPLLTATQAPVQAAMGSGAGGLGSLLANNQMLTGAGIGALGGAITNPDDPLRGALTGGISGGLGGYGADALAGQAGAGGMLGQIGSFAAEHPNITSAGLGMLAQPLVSGLIPSSNDSSKIPGILSPEEEKKQWIAALNRYKPSLAPGYAAGGITDLDNFQSNAQNVSTTGLNFAQPTTGTLSIPNPQEVANPEGYGANSTALMAVGGIADLGGYAAGGRPNLLHGSGDGVSDDIPATIAGKQPARLAEGEYVVPSRIVSELGNGSTDAGAARLDDMVKRIQTGRRKTLHGKDYAKDTRAYKHLPA